MSGKKLDWRGLFRMAVIALAFATAGCAAGKDPMVHAATGPEAQAYDNLWQSSLDVLSRYNFRVDRQDRWAGIIKTEPLVGKSIFELCRPDAATSCDAWESTLQTIYRTAEVQIHRSNGEYYPVVRVYVSRADTGVPAITSDADAYRYFRETPAHRQERELHATSKPALPTQLGVDELLAGRIAADIMAEVKSRPQ